MNYRTKAGVDPGFPVEGRGLVLGGCGPPTWVLFDENVCENERIGSCWGGVCRKILCVDPPMEAEVEKTVADLSLRNCNILKGEF